jgi:hypothetical protein
MSLSRVAGDRSPATRLRSLGSLWASHGRRDAARDLLAPVLDSYTEGFDTPDLTAASALLEWLSIGTGEIPFTPDAVVLAVTVPSAG